MSSVSNSESSTEEQSSPEIGASSPEPAVSSEVHADESGDDASSSSLFDKLDTAATIVRVSILAFVVVFTLIPVVGLLAGWAPFDPPPKLPYFALVGFALVGTVALVAAEMLDV